MLSEINKKIERIDTAAKAERKASPDLVQKTKASRYPKGIRRAYCKTAAPADTKITCYLDTDVTGWEIEVNCSIAGGGNLNAAIPRLADGTLVFVSKIDDAWYCISPFQAAEVCDCYTI